MPNQTDMDALLLFAKKRNQYTLIKYRILVCLRPQRTIAIDRSLAGFQLAIFLIIDLHQQERVQ